MKKVIVTHKKNIVVLKKNQANVLELEDELFLPDCSVIMPINATKGITSVDIGSNISGVRTLGLVFKQIEFDPAMRILVTGHSDDDNKSTKEKFTLSGERADNVYNLIMGRKNEWVENSMHRHTIRSCKKIIQLFSAIKNLSVNISAVDDSWDDNVKQAVNSFLTFIVKTPLEVTKYLKLIENHVAHLWPKQVWEAVYDLYEEQLISHVNMTTDKIKKYRHDAIKTASIPGLHFYKTGAKVVACGCSVKLNSLTPNDTANCKYTSIKNTRVEVLFFDQDATFSKQCVNDTTADHPLDKCPLWNPTFIHRNRLDPKDLKSTMYHLMFLYYNQIRKKVEPIPAGLEVGHRIKAYETDKQVAGVQLAILNVTNQYKDGVYSVKVPDNSIPGNRTDLYFTFEIDQGFIFTQDIKTDPIIKEPVSPVDDAILDGLNPANAAWYGMEQRSHYYDLPQIWSSENYWTRYNNSMDTGGRFTDILKTTLKLKPFDTNVTEFSKPLMFSFDDIVLVDSTGSQEISDKDSGDASIALSADSRYTLFNVENEKLVVYNPGDPDDPDGPQYTNVRFTENIISNVPEHPRVVAFANGFYDVMNKRSGNKINRFDWTQAAMPFDTAKKQVCGCRAAMLNDPDFHFWEALKYDPANPKPTLYANQTGNFELHYLHDSCLVKDPSNPNTIIEQSFVLVYWSARFKCEIWTAAHQPLGSPRDVSGFKKIVLSDKHWKNYAHSGIKNAKERWESKGYTIVQQTPVNNGKLIKLAFFFEGKKTNSGGAHKCLVTVSNDSGTGFMGITESEMYYVDYEARDYLHVGPYKDIDGKIYKTLVVAHEFSHAEGKDDEYSYDNQFVQYYPGMPYQFDSGSLMQTNRAPRMKHIWFFVNWLNEKALTAGLINNSISNRTFCISHTAGSKKLSFYLPSLPVDYRNIYKEHASSTDSLVVGNVGSNKILGIASYKLGEDELSWSIRVANKLPKTAFNGIVVVYINILLQFENFPVWTNAQAKKCRSQLLAVFTEKLNNQFTLRDPNNAHDYKNTYIYFFPVIKYALSVGETPHCIVTYYKKGELDTLGKIKPEVFAADNVNNTLNVCNTVHPNFIIHWILGNYDPAKASPYDQFGAKTAIKITDLNFIQKWFAKVGSPGNNSFVLSDK